MYLICVDRQASQDPRSPPWPAEPAQHAGGRRIGQERDDPQVVGREPLRAGLLDLTAITPHVYRLAELPAAMAAAASVGSLARVVMTP